MGRTQTSAATARLPLPPPPLLLLLVLLLLSCTVLSQVTNGLDGHDRGIDANKQNVFLNGEGPAPAHDGVVAMDEETFRRLTLSSERPAPLPSHFEQHMHGHLRRRLGESSEKSTKEDLDSHMRRALQRAHEWREEAARLRREQAATERGRRLAATDYTPVGFPIVLSPLNAMPTVADINMTFARAQSVISPGWVDWTASMTVNTTIYDQGNTGCQSCYVVASTDLLAMHWSLANNLATPIHLAPSHVCGCSFNAACCSGGNPEWVYMFALLNGGIAALLDYPYAMGTSCRKPPRLYARLTSWEKFKPLSNALMLRQVSQGPIIALFMAPPSFANYGGGVFNTNQCAKSYNHALIVVGFRTDVAQPYWIVKNSWGPNWGVNGYAYIAMTNGKGVCGLLGQPLTYPVFYPQYGACVAPNPCGAGTCTMVNGVARCICPAGFVERLEQYGPKCVAATACNSNPNPCGPGTCSNKWDGSYTCTCPDGTVIGSQASGGQTCVVGTFQNGLQTYTTLPDDNCTVLTWTFGLTTTQILAKNPFLNCSEPIDAGTVVVIAGNPTFNCSASDVIQPGDTCLTVAGRNGITQAQLQLLNPTLSCSQLRISQAVCTAPGVLVAKSGWERSCGDTDDVLDTDDCFTFMSRNNLTIPILYWLNPGLDCSSPLDQTELCTKTLQLQLFYVRCNTWYNVTQGDTCASLALAARMNITDFININPGVRCYRPYWHVGLAVCVSGSLVAQADAGVEPMLFPYSVQEDDTLVSIALMFADRCYNMSNDMTPTTGYTAQICQQNRFPNCTDRWIVPGSMIFIPCFSLIGLVKYYSPCNTVNSTSNWVCGASYSTFMGDCDARVLGGYPILRYNGPCNPSLDPCDYCCTGFSGSSGPFSCSGCGSWSPLKFCSCPTWPLPDTTYSTICWGDTVEEKQCNYYFLQLQHWSYGTEAGYSNCIDAIRDRTAFNCRQYLPAIYYPGGFNGKCSTSFSIPGCTKASGCATCRSTNSTCKSPMFK